MITRSDVKLALRYSIIFYILYLTWVVIQPAYGNSHEEAGVLQVIIGAVFGALSMIMGFHFNSQIDKG